MANPTLPPIIVTITLKLRFPGTKGRTERTIDATEDVSVENFGSVMERIKAFAEATPEEVEAMQDRISALKGPISAAQFEVNTDHQERGMK